MSVVEQKLRLLMKIVKRINSNLSLQETIWSIITEAKLLTESESSSLILVDEATRDLYFTVSTDDKEDILKTLRIPAGKGIAGFVAETGNRVVINNAEKDERFFREVDNATNVKTRNLMCVPLFLKGRILGVLEVINKSGNSEYTDGDLVLLGCLADFAALAINYQELYQKSQRRAYETNALYRLSETMNISKSLDELLKANLKIVSETLECERVSLIFREGDVGRIKSSIGVPVNIVNEPIVLENIIGLMVMSGKSVMCPDINEDERFKTSRRYMGNSFMAVPLKSGDSVFACLCVTERKKKIPYRHEDMVLFEMLAQQISENYRHFKLWEEHKENQRTETELAFTAHMQQEILPKNFPVTEELDIAARSIPAKFVGGDFYDFIPMKKGKYLLIIADVSGKGLTAGMFMAISRSVLRAHSDHMNSPAKLLQWANRRIFADSISGMFVTCFCCLLDTGKKEITFANAGHPPQLIFRSDKKEIESLHAHGRPLGVLEKAEFENRKITYGKGDILLLFTDGITETINKLYEEFGEHRLQASLNRNCHCGKSDELNGRILEDVARFQGEMEQFDDITMMSVRFG